MAYRRTVGVSLVTGEQVEFFEPVVPLPLSLEPTSGEIAAQRMATLRRMVYAAPIVRWYSPGELAGV